MIPELRDYQREAIDRVARKRPRRGFIWTARPNRQARLMMAAMNIAAAWSRGQKTFAIGRHMSDSEIAELEQLVWEQVLLLGGLPEDNPRRGQER